MPILKRITQLGTRVLNSGEGRKLKTLQSLVPDIGAFEPTMKALTDDDLQAYTNDFRRRYEQGEPANDLLPEAFAVVREASWRVLGQRHYDVQLVGGVALHLGCVAEMKTGEGKTLCSTLPIYLNGVTGQGVHVVTVNDYLAARDAEWMGRLYKWLGLSVGIILPDHRDSEHKRRQYGCDITYGTNNEFGFDYLRDNMAMTKADQVQRGHRYCIVDEIDSILIDEARTPLIISGQVADTAKLYSQFAKIAQNLVRDTHYEVDEEKRTVAPLEEGVHAVEKMLGIENLYDQVSQNLVHQIQAALRAKELYKQDRDYILDKGQVKIVDEFTGRVLEGRRWSDGIHQAVEAKENVSIKQENQTLATITLQNYYRLYDRLAGMTGTAQTEASEFVSTYNMQVVTVPTHRSLQRADEADLIYKTEDSKFRACVEDIQSRYEKGQPVLVGTVSVETSEKLSQLLKQQGIIHQVLNAKQHQREAEIVAQAGRLGAVTVATNMAGRGVDILLGGNPEMMALKELKAEHARNDRHTKHDRHAKHNRNTTNDKNQRIEADSQSRLDALTDKHRRVTDIERDKVIELGGLYVLGTERHESRRIDNQLRGRSGRQGDPGESRFYLSLEDELMRLFASNAMTWVMDRALPEDVPIEAKMVTKAIERAQNTVEQRNAETRKNVLKYDEVMNAQRQVIYERRKQILDGADLKSQALEYLATALQNEIATYCVSDYHEEWDLPGLATEISALWPQGVSVELMAAAETVTELTDIVKEAGVTHYDQREQELGEQMMRQIERQVMLRIIDQKWRQHLKEMDLLREGIHLRAMGQKDPATEWQREGFDMFSQMLDSAAMDFVKYVMHIRVATPASQDTPQIVGVNASKTASNSHTFNVSHSAAMMTNKRAQTNMRMTDNQPQKPKVKTADEKIGRNELCPCNSGKKYKHCCYNLSR